MPTTGPRFGKRLMALVLALALLVLLIVGLIRGMLDTRLGETLVLGTVCGGWFAFRGDLPTWLRDLSGMTEDDDPRNISPRIYLPILLTLIALGAAAIAFVVSR